MKVRVGAALGLLVASRLGSAAIYKWLDGEGQTHFADVAPAGVVVQRVDLHAALEADAPSDSGLSADERAWLDELEKRRQQGEAEGRRRKRRAAAAQARREAQAERDAGRCAGYRERIREYQNRLRAGCRVSACNSYEAQITRYRRRAALVCRR